MHGETDEGSGRLSEVEPQMLNGLERGAPKSKQARHSRWQRKRNSGHCALETVGDIALLRFRSGEVAVVDFADCGLVERYNWHVVTQEDGRKYVRSRPRFADGTRTTLLLHRLLLQPPDGQPVDHRDGDGLNNRRSNLRLCTFSQNTANSPTAPRGSSGYRGVSPRRGGFRARLWVNHALVSVGDFATAEEAAAARDAAAIKAFGEFADLNFEVAE